MITKVNLDKLLTDYTTEEGEAWNLTVGDQLAIEQLKALRAIKGGVNFMVVVLVIWIFISLINTLGALMGI